MEPDAPSAVAAQNPGCDVRAGGTLVGAALRNGRELLLAVAPDEGSERGQIATTLLQRAPGAEECWVPTDDSDLPNALASHGWRPSTVDLQMRLRLAMTTYAALPDGVRLAELTGSDDSALHGARARTRVRRLGRGQFPTEFLNRYVRHPAYDAGLWWSDTTGTASAGQRSAGSSSCRTLGSARWRASPSRRERAGGAWLRHCSASCAGASPPVGSPWRNWEFTRTTAAAPRRCTATSGWVQASSKTQWEPDV